MENKGVAVMSSSREATPVNAVVPEQNQHTTITFRLNDVAGEIIRNAIFIIVAFKTSDRSGLQ